MLYNLITKLETAMNQDFPLSENNPATTTKITPEVLGKALGFMQRNFDGVQPLLNYFVFNDLVHPELGYKMYFDAPALFYDFHVYQSPEWETQYKPDLIQRIVYDLQTHFKAIGIDNVTPEEITAEAGRIADFEFLLAQGIQDLPGDDDGLIYNKITVKNATDTFPKAIDLTAFLTELAKGVKNLDKVVLDPDYEIIVQWPPNYNTFVTTLANIGNRVNDNTIWNYLFVRIILAKEQYLPGAVADYNDLHHKQIRPTIFQEPKIKRKVPPFPEWHPIMEEESGFLVEGWGFLCRIPLSF